MNPLARARAAKPRHPAAAGVAAPRHAVQGRPSPAPALNDEMRETIKQLQERWTPEITAQTLADASPRSPFGRLPSGLWDFRGFGDFDWRLHLQKLGVPESIINDDMKESQLEKLHFRGKHVFPVMTHEGSGEDR